MKKKFKHLGELELVNLAKSSDTHIANEAFEEIFHRYKSALYRLICTHAKGASKEDYEDIMQIVFVKVSKKIATYEANFKFMTWIAKIAKNTIIDESRKKQLQTSSMYQTDDEGTVSFVEVVDHNQNPENLQEKEQRINFARNLVSKLEDEYKLIIELIYFEERTYDEAAELLGIPVGTLKAKIFRAKKIMREELQKTEVEI